MNPRWALHVAKHLVKFEYDDPLWDRERGQVTAREVITLFGLTLGSEKRIDFGRVDPKEARRIFLADALAADALSPRAPAPTAVLEPEFLAHNRKLRAEVLDWEARLRKRDLFIGEPGVAAFYDARLPAGIHDRATLATWCATTAERPHAADDGRRRREPRSRPSSPTSASRTSSRSRGRSCRCAIASSPARSTTASRSRCRARCSVRCGPSRSTGSCRVGSARR